LIELGGGERLLEGGLKERLKQRGDAGGFHFWLLVIKIWTPPFRPESNSRDLNFTY
jgi:hypothetical protein